MQVKNINRRSFLKTTAITGGVLGLGGIPFALSAEQKDNRLVILHTNDTHSRIDPYPANDPNFPLMGGYARRAALINQIRQENTNVLLLDAGDIFQGTPFFNMYGGEAELKLMSKMGYDAGMMGNHEFDNGLDGFLEVLPHASFPFITSNYDFSQTILNGKTANYKTFQRGSIKVGVYSLGIELEGLVGRNLYAKTIYVDPIEVAQRTERILKENLNCDLIVCLSHLGYSYETSKVSDVVVAESTRFTDIILGGHTHTILDPLDQKENLRKNKVHIGQTGFGGVRLGRVDVIISENKGEVLVESNTINISKNQYA